MNTRFVWTTYFCCLTGVPFLVEWSLFRQFVTHWTHQWAIRYDNIPADFIIMTLAMACMYTYVISDLLVRSVDLVHPRWSSPLRMGFQHLQQMFPAFAASLWLVQANTNIHMWHSRAFIAIQTVLFVYLPFSFCSGGSSTITTIAYRSVLAWTLLYSIIPHDVANALWYLSRLHAATNDYYYVL